MRPRLATSLCYPTCCCKCDRIQCSFLYPWHRIKSCLWPGV